MTYLRRMAVPAALFLAILLMACQQETELHEPEKDVGATAIATIMGKDGEPMGTVTLTQGPRGFW